MKTTQEILDKRLNSMLQAHDITSQEGPAQSCDAYGIPYVTFCNGYVKPEGTAAQHPAVNDLIGFFLSQLLKQLKYRDNLIIWRQKPTIEIQENQIYIYSRFTSYAVGWTPSADS